MILLQGEVLLLGVCCVTHLCCINSIHLCLQHPASAAVRFYRYSAYALHVIHPSVINWYHNYLHRNRAMHWYSKPGIGNDHAHVPK